MINVSLRPKNRRLNHPKSEEMGCITSRSKIDCKSSSSYCYSRSSGSEMQSDEGSLASHESCITVVTMSPNKRAATSHRRQPERKVRKEAYACEPESTVATCTTRDFDDMLAEEAAARAHLWKRSQTLGAKILSEEDKCRGVVCYSPRNVIFY